MRRLHLLATAGKLQSSEFDVRAGDPFGDSQDTDGFVLHFETTGNLTTFWFPDDSGITPDRIATELTPCPRQIWIHLFAGENFGISWEELGQSFHAEFNVDEQIDAPVCERVSHQICCPSSN